MVMICTATPSNKLFIYWFTLSDLQTWYTLIGLYRHTYRHATLYIVQTHLETYYLLVNAETYADILHIDWSRHSYITYLPLAVLEHPDDLKRLLCMPRLLRCAKYLSDCCVQGQTVLEINRDYLISFQTFVFNQIAPFNTLVFIRNYARYLFTILSNLHRKKV